MLEELKSDFVKTLDRELNTKVSDRMSLLERKDGFKRSKDYKNADFEKKDGKALSNRWAGMNQIKYREYLKAIVNSKYLYVLQLFCGGFVEIPSLHLCF